MNYIKKISHSVTCIIIYLFLSLIINHYLQMFIKTSNSFLLNIINLISPIIICIILVMLNKELFKNKFKDLKINFKKYFSIMVKYYFLGVTLMIVTNFILTYFLKATPINEALNRDILTKLPLFATISVLILAPISEEIAFRGSFKKLFKSELVFSLVTSLIFGSIHVIFNGDFLFIIPYASLAFFFASAYFKTDNILVSITMHSFHNLLCLLLIFIGGLV